MGGGTGILARLARVYGLQAAREYGRQPWLLAAGTVTSYLGRGAAIPFVVVYLTQQVGIPLTAIGAGVVAEQVTRALLSPIFGSWSDRWGRKPFMVLGVTLQALVFPAYLLVQDVPTYLAISVLAGLGQAPYQPALSAFLADVTPAQQRVGVFGLVHMTKNVGWGLGIALGGLLIARSFGLLFVVGGALPLVYAILLVAFLREPPRAVPRHARRSRRVKPRAPKPPSVWRHVLREPRFIAFLVLATVIFLSWGQLNTALPAYITDAKGLALDETWVTRAFAVNSVLIIALQVPISAHVERWSRTTGLAVAGVVTAAAYALVALTYDLALADAGLAQMLLLAAVVVLTLAEMLDTPLTFTLASELAPPGARGGAMGVLGLAAPLGMGAAPFLAGLITGLRSWSWVWGTFAALVLAGSLGFLLLGRAMPKRAPASETAPA